MNCSFVSGKIPLWSGLMVTLPARVFHLFCVGQETPLTLPYGHIAYKGTSPLHELLFCVGQDSPLKLPYGYIACKGTSHIHELLLCVDWDFSLILPSDHIVCILTLHHLYVLHLDVVSIFPLRVFVYHKCCNCASKIHLPCIDRYSCFLPNLSKSSPFLRNSCEVLMLIVD